MVINNKDKEITTAGGQHFIVYKVLPYILFIGVLHSHRRTILVLS